MGSQLLDRALLIGVLLAPLLISFDFMLQLQLTPFIVLGFISLLSTYLPLRYQFLIIPLIYLPAIVSLGILVLEKKPQYLIDLASGYLISIPFLTVIGLAKSANLKNSVIGYIASLTSAYFTWVIAYESKDRGGGLFLSLISAFTDRQAWEKVEPPQSFAAFTALSSIALIIYLWRARGSVTRHLQSGPFIYAAVSASIAVASIVLYSLAFSDSVALGLIVAAFLTLAATVRAGVLERWRKKE
ncbi:MAG: hypothetical protein RMJ28_02445 [Nitrososphaerota archaeon]|nr:hypothetical protein [Candidatus Calditenuaceae archaeon]MDW8073082.1 hypothetical protein [Nitrososphaerota archaeon]